MQDPASETWAMDLFLMSHFTSSTMQTLFPRMDVLNLWQTVVVADAAFHPFLLHGMLALSSLHLASLWPSGQGARYTWLCQNHQGHAVSQYRHALEDVKLDQIGPVLAMAQIIAFLSLATLSDNALPKEGNPVSSDDGFKDVLALSTMLRGVPTILQGSRDRNRFKDSPYGIVMSVYKHIRSGTLYLPASTRSRYELLRTDCLSDLVAAGNINETAICRKAIDDLEVVHNDAVRNATGNALPDMLLHVDPLYLMKWAAIVSSDFITLLHSRHTAALVIMGEFASLFELVGKKWFLKNWVNNVLDIIRAIIAQPGLKWLRS
jgi:hypothetical protein